jgi:hypothetical protein
MQKIRYWFRYYFIRKKAPLSYILWCHILRREVVYSGSYAVSIAAANAPDGSISLNQGAPGNNSIEIDLYDAYNKRFHTVKIELSYRSMKKVRAGFDEAFQVSRQKIREENSHA